MNSSPGMALRKHAASKISEILLVLLFFPKETLKGFKKRYELARIYVYKKGGIV